MIGFSKVGVVLGLLALTANAMAADDAQYQFGELYLVNHEDLSPDQAISGGARVGLGIPFATSERSRASLEIGAFGNGIERVAGATGTQLGLMVDVVQGFKLGGFQPFVLAGVGIVGEDDSTGGLGFYPALEAGLGALVGSMRLSLTAQEVFNDEVTPLQDNFIDYRFNVGFVVGEAAAPARAPAAPLDSDGDGVPDSIDRCPAQAAPTADGCPAPLAPAEPPRDSDGDGVDDTRDECPGTLEGLKVDASGCVISASAQTIVLKGVNFLAGSAELTPEAKAVLDDAYIALAGQTNLRIEVGGHTDSSGADAVNLALSQRRAESVRQYLSGRGISADRLVAKGYGETQPVADNSTAEGRRTNRRVELKILN
jgi:OmpA-OmpF porin, OOP family